jgi:hypothetical protein
MRDSVEQSGREATVAKYRQIIDQELADDELLMEALPKGSGPETAEDRLVNFLSTVRHSEAVRHLREVERMAVYLAVAAPTAAELQQLWHVRWMYQQIAEIGAAHQAWLQAEEAGKRSRKRVRLPAVHEDRLLKHLDEPEPLKGLRLAEKRAAYMQPIPMLDYQHEALYFLRELIERVEPLAAHGAAFDR